MANLNLVLHPNKILEKKCEPVKEVTDKLKTLAAQMHINMIKWKGVGLSGPQVGRLIQIITINTLGNEDKWVKRTMYNPLIVETGNLIKMQEGCISFPYKYLDLDRPESIVVTYLDGFNKQITEKFEGLAARAIQHEIDHLRGELFINYGKNERISDGT